MKTKFIKNLLISFLMGILLSSCTIHSRHSDNPKTGRNWFSWGKAGDTYNPVRKAKKKPSQIQAEDNAKVMKKAKRMVRREKRKLRRTKGAYKT